MLPVESVDHGSQFIKCTILFCDDKAPVLANGILAMILVNVINLQSCLPPQHNTSWPRVSDLWLPGMRHIHIIDHRMMAAGRAHARRLTRRRPDRHDDADFPVLLKGEGDGYNASVWRDGSGFRTHSQNCLCSPIRFCLKE